MSGTLLLIRHQESDWNALGKWTGVKDRLLTEKGAENSEELGLLIRDIIVDVAFTSMQVRTIETLSCILNVCKQLEVPTIHSEKLNERDYGDYTGKNKWEIEEELGEETFKKLRRSFDYPIPNGESLKDVYNRTIPFYISDIVPEIQKDKQVLVVAHGNSLRSLIKYIESISDEDIVNLEMPFDVILMYKIDENGKMITKEVRKIEQQKNA